MYKSISINMLHNHAHYADRHISEQYFITGLKLCMHVDVHHFNIAAGRCGTDFNCLIYED